MHSLTILSFSDLPLLCTQGSRNLQEIHGVEPFSLTIPMGIAKVLENAVKLRRKDAIVPQRELNSLMDNDHFAGGILSPSYFPFK